MIRLVDIVALSIAKKLKNAISFGGKPRGKLRSHDIGLCNGSGFGDDYILCSEISPKVPCIDHIGFMSEPYTHMYIKTNQKTTTG